MLTADDEATLHQRLIDGDVTAPDDCAERCFALVYAGVRHRHPEVHDLHLVEEAAGKAIFDYVQRPIAYKPARLRLIPYLVMAAVGDLLNALKRESRHAARRASLEAVELRQPGGNDCVDDEKVELPPGVTREQAIAELWRRLPDLRDRRVVELMIIDGERDSEVFARALGIEHLPLQERRDEVKRAKDRIKKVIQRLREELRGDAAS